MRAVAATHRSAIHVSGRPAWLAFNPATRVLSGTPDAVGTHDLTYVVRDSDGDEATDAFTFTVAEPDTTPTAPDVPDQSAVQGVAFSTTLDCGQRRQRTAHPCCQRASCMAKFQPDYTGSERDAGRYRNTQSCLTLSATPTATRPLTRSELPSPSRTRSPTAFPMCLTRQPFKESPSPLPSLRAAAATHRSPMLSAGVLDGWPSIRLHGF